jgi:DNA processing protein
VGRLTDEQVARWTLAGVAEPADPALGRAVARSGAAEVLAAVRERRSGLAGEPHYLVRLAGLDHDAQARRLREVGGRFVVPGDGEWPTQLADLGDRQPLGLFVRGQDLRLAAVRSVAVVGARAATDYGVHVAVELAADLAGRGWVVVSGGAYGIDAAAHRGALAAGGTTVAVLACGVDVTYPRGHQALLGRVGSDGVLVSELPPGSTPTRARFLIRNRVIAALSAGTVVVEAATRSGALSTAASAAGLGRFVMAVPGPVTSPMSAGAHRLIQREPPARLVTGADDVVEEVGAIGQLAPAPVVQRRVRDTLDATTLRVIENVPPRRAASTSEVSQAAGLEAGVVTSALQRLLLVGLVERTPQGWCQTDRAREPLPRAQA